MSEIIDLKQEFITAKSKESIVAFAGFRFTVDAAGKFRDGLIIISSRERSDGSGYLRLNHRAFDLFCDAVFVPGFCFFGVDRICAFCRLDCRRS